MPGSLAGRALSAAGGASLERDPVAERVALVAGAIFVPAGLVKFIFYGWELHAFRRFGLPAPAALVILAGVLETAGGALLLARRLVRATALVLATTMVVAVAVSGVGHGDVIPSLTLAPALGLAMAFLLVRRVPNHCS